MLLRTAPEIFLHFAFGFGRVVAVGGQLQHLTANSNLTAYGPPIPLEVARKVVVAALAETRKNNWNMAVAVVDRAGTWCTTRRCTTRS